MGEKEECGSNRNLSIRVREVSVLKGRAREKAMEKDLDENDLVILKRTVNSLPEYEVEKIEGEPVKYLLEREA